MKRGEVRGYVLAGGESSRMRGPGLPQDKASLVWRGQTLLERASLLLQNVCETSRVLCGTKERCARLKLGLSGVEDRFKGMGPLGGLEAALADAEEHAALWVLIVPVDLPYLTASLLDVFVSRALASQASASCLRAAGFTQPLPALVHVEALPSVQALLLAGHRRVLPSLMNVAQQIRPEFGLAAIEASDIPCISNSHWFWNVNTPEDLDLMEQSETSQTGLHQSTYGK